MKDIVLPELGEGISQATVAYWHYALGDVVKKDDDVVEVVTDKAVFQIPAEMDGTLKEICVPAGQEAVVGGLLGRLEP